MAWHDIKLAWHQARFSESISAVEALGSKVEDKEILVRQQDSLLCYIWQCAVHSSATSMYLLMLHSGLNGGLAYLATRVSYGLLPLS